MSGSRRFRAPGRVNLIGEHTDYNLGFVMPIALDLVTDVETSPSDDGNLHVYSEHRQEWRSWALADIEGIRPEQQWSDYVLGVAVELTRLGFEIPALTLRIHSTVPEGSGLSSSAALEVSSALALLQGRELDRLEIALLCQRAESSFVRLPSGIMDQFVAVFGVRDAALRIDCRTLQSASVQLPSGASVIAVNSMVKHELGDSAYRTRVAECAEAAQALRVASLRDATLPMLENAKLADKPLRRARHVITENQRVLRFSDAAAANDLLEMGRLFAASQESMRSDYEITCPEIDFLAQAASQLPGCYGARMTGGGFGGCTVNLVDEAAADSFETAIARAYGEKFGITPAVYRCRPADGAGEIFF